MKPHAAAAEVLAGGCLLAGADTERKGVSQSVPVLAAKLDSRAEKSAYLVDWLDAIVHNTESVSDT